jgi:hypothetical protein
MEGKRYNFGSPEVQQFLGLSPSVINPSTRQTYIRNLVDRLGAADVPDAYENAFVNQGVQLEDLKKLQNYIDFNLDWKSANSIEAINKLTEIAQSNPSEIYSYSTKESPLYRGARIDPATIPSIGEPFSFNRFKSFTPDVLVAAPFTQGYKPWDIDNPTFFPKKNSNTIKTLFQIQQEPSDKFNYLITPGAGEPEVLSRPSAQYLVEDKLRLPFNQRELGHELYAPSLKELETPSYHDVNFVKLRQFHGIDPLAASIKGGFNLLKKNLPGSTIGAGFAALDPTIVKQIENNNYGKAATSIAKDVVIGGLAEEGLKLAGKYAPGLTRALAPVLNVVAPVFAGGALFMQGKPGSLTDVLTKKAGDNPVSWLPSIKPNPKTDIGARASRAITNEASYAFNQLLKGKLPYIK